MKKQFMNNNSLIRIVLVCVMSLFVSTMCGCGVPTLTDEENYEISRYIADKLLQYDRTYGEGEELVYIDPNTMTPSPETTDAPIATVAPVATDVPSTSVGDDGSVGTTSPSGGTADGEEGGSEQGDSSSVDSNEADQTIVADWSEFFTTDEWVITYSSYDTCQSYPKQSDVYLVEASKGNKLLVISFDVFNKAKKKIHIDLTESGLNYRLYVNEQEYEPMIAILDNGGLMYLNIRLNPNEHDEAVLIFEVPEGADLSTMRLDVSK